MIYPNVKVNSQALILVKLRGQNIWREAMFYWNGKRPSFVSYGSDVSELVEKWRYL